MFISKIVQRRGKSLIRPSLRSMLPASQRGVFGPTLPLFKSGNAYARENFANGTSSVYFDQMYEQWIKDPDSVHPSFAAYFSNVDSGADAAYSAPPTLGKKYNDLSSQIA